MENVCEFRKIALLYGYLTDDSIEADAGLRYIPTIILLFNRRIIS